MENKIIISEDSKESRYAWHDGFPIGNGRLGAMITDYSWFEEISLNEDSLWYGTYHERTNPDGKKYLEEIRSLLQQGKVKEADKLCYLAMTSSPKYFGSYEPMCSLYLIQNVRGEIKNYRRELDLEQSIVSMSYDVDRLKVRRECFVSYPDQVMVFKFSADQPRLDMQVNLVRRPYDMGTDIPEENVLHMPGQCGPGGICFDCMLTAKTNGRTSRIGDYISFEEASEIVLYVTANSNFYETSPYEKTLQQLHNAAEQDYEILKERHIADYQALYRRASVDFGTQSVEALPERLEKVRAGGTDKGLLELLFNYGRYLMISASRPGTQAMNLQGIWNKTYAPPWDCNYTININTEMNYWIAESTGLSECHEPLFVLLERMVPNGEKTAEHLYGCEGFVAHHATTLWGDTAGNGFSFPSSVWPMGGAWLSLHMWDRYLYTGDQVFLKERAFPILKKAAHFFTQYLTLAEDGCYVSGPSLSPENVYITEDGSEGKECMAPEMDNQILRALFRTVIHAYEIVGDCDEKEYQTYRYFLSKLRPTRINKNGCIMEWDKDYEELDPGHRHISPLWGLYPDSQIALDKTPELAKACERTLERRNREDTQGFVGFYGWVGAWVACCYARLGMAEEAKKCLYDLLKKCVTNSLLSIYPVYQIDGNFGATAAVVELLLRSEEDRIVLLPALPAELDTGSFHGLCARGGFVIDAKWREGKICNAVITSRNGNICRVKAEGCRGVNTSFVVEDGFIVFHTEKGRTYELLCG
ncbi:MAG: glycoside hydrolase family 95 protein [Roseburia sp.]|nr:glycoside hydrolase family 95 protein [Roseburia sp.]